MTEFHLDDRVRIVKWDATFAGASSRYDGLEGVVVQLPNDEYPVYFSVLLDDDPNGPNDGPLLCRPSEMELIE